MGRFDEFEEREKIAGAEAIGSGGFSKHLMERSGLLLYASQVGKGKARIVIEYDNDTGKGMIGVFKYSPIPTDQTDMENCIVQRQENAKNAQGAGKEGETMNSYVIGIEVNDGKLKELMDRIDAAQREIFNCYCELQRLGVLKITPAVEQPGQEISDPGLQ